VAAPSAATAETVALDFFFSPGCDECGRVKADVLPELEERYEGFYTLAWHDISQAANLPLLIAYQQRCGNTDNGRASIVVDHTVFLSGYEAIATGLLARVDEALAGRQRPGWRAPRPPALDDSTVEEAARERVSALTVLIVVAGGLTDGFNPCAISTLIFFLSLLAALKVGKRTRLLVGLSFIAASFLVYFVLGFGFLEFVRGVPSFTRIRRGFEIVVGCALIPLALLSFRDAFRFRRSGQAKDVTLQIPQGIKTRMHAIMRSGLGLGGPVASGALIGAAVTVLESVCTGQGYLPVLTYLAKAGHFDLQAAGLLALYNLLFVAPLAVVFVCFHYGMQITSLIAWSRRNLAVVKILLGLFFAAVAALLLFGR